MSEILFIAVLALLLIGPKQLPELARNLGRFLNELKRSTSVFTDELKMQTREDFHQQYIRPDPVEKKDEPKKEQVASEAPADKKDQPPS
ncbi:MAG: preprotein translocase [Bdellovibrio sp. CG10_big_fil_rev_8_21_14_0_10_47_8]|nr:MAG: preprotein translocase [Bdellovibrio sp. CG10_big_fil_rev_8_21_14_0_10_47_8]